MYQALYRKYRPLDFDDVVGQESIIKTLKNSIKNNNFSHAYMFFGPRGIGKTSISKIFARNINCLNPIDGLACKKCDNCNISFSKNCVDIIEIDAASNNGVDEIRDLKNKISLVPSELKYKVYIIDEVHMLSIGAFNALLKTLEEPPEHAIFILATTDPQKVPETIISRCQCFNFKRISPEVIKSTLLNICKKEKIKVEDNVLESIAFLSEGGLRDALGLLDKLNSYSNSNIKYEDFVEINGIVSNDDLSNLFNYIFENNIENVLNSIASFDSSGKNLIQIYIQMLNFSRNLLVDYYLKKAKLNFNESLVQDFVNLLNDKLSDIKKSSNPRIFLELLLLNFMNKKEVVLPEKVTENVFSLDKTTEVIPNERLSVSFANIVESNLEKDNKISIEDENNDDKLVEKNKIDSNHTNDDLPKVLNIDDIMSVRINNIFAKADKNLLKTEIKSFEKLKDYTFDQNFGYIVCNLLDSKVRVVSEDAILISFDLDSIVEQNILIIDKLTEVYNKLLGNSKKIAIVSDNRWEELKKEYISNLKNNVSYSLMEEPIAILEDGKKDDIISNSAIDLFGDIVEID